MAPPALHLRENPRSRRQGRRHDPLGRTIGGLDQQRANGSQYNATCSFTRAELPLVVFAPRLYVKQRHSLAKPTQHLYRNDILENTLFKISTGRLALKLLCTGGQFLS